MHAMRFVRWIIGATLCFYGVTLVVGCVAYLISGESTTSIWVDFGLVTALGIVPLVGGIMLLLMKPRPFAGMIARRMRPNEVAPPNGGPAMSPGNSDVMEGPPSVS